MPMYGYRCKKCEHEYEVFYRSIKSVESEEPEEVCPKCASKEKEKLVNQGTSFLLKGRGWAKDRYS